MNQIVVRANAGEYSTGDTIYGAVYLNIENPTAGCGVRLKFRGYERFAYGIGSGVDSSCPLHSEQKDYIDCSDIILYKTSNPLSLGSYVFPFQFSLLHEIPGSFSAEGDSDVRWEARVEYWVQAEMIGSESVQARQSITVLQRFSSQKPAVAEHKVKCYLGLQHKNFSLTARLLEPEQRVLDYANLRLLITNQSTRKVKSISIKLNREISLCSKSSSTLSLVVDPNIRRMDRKIWISPEQESVTVYELCVNEDQGLILNRGMDKLKIPLFIGNTPIREAIPATTHGAHVQCRYKIEATAHLENGQHCAISLPVKSIRPYTNKQWCNWEVPDWINNKLTVMETLSPFSVQPHILYGEAFSGLPPFQHL